MNETYADTIEKLQQQGIETLKQAQAAQSAAINSFRELYTNATNKLPGAETLRYIPTIVAQVSELNAAFAVKLIEQQNEYVSQLVNVLKSAKAETQAADTAEKA